MERQWIWFEAIGALFDYFSILVGFFSQIDGGTHMDCGQRAAA
jgi:hypothetical protein